MFWYPPDWAGPLQLILMQSTTAKLEDSWHWETAIRAESVTKKTNKGHQFAIKIGARAKGKTKLTKLSSSYHIWLCRCPLPRPPSLIDFEPLSSFRLYFVTCCLSSAFHTFVKPCPGLSVNLGSQLSWSSPWGPCLSSCSHSKEKNLCLTFFEFVFI